MPVSEAAKQVLQAVKDGKAKPGVAERSARAIRIKDELNKILELVVHSREALENELSTEFAQQKRGIDDKFLRKLEGLSKCYVQLTDAQTRLHKSEKAMEDELTPAQEKAAVLEYVASLPNEESYLLITKMWERHKAMRDVRGARGADDLPE